MYRREVDGLIAAELQYWSRLSASRFVDVFERFPLLLLPAVIVIIVISVEKEL
jgi:hypothetical protein